MDGSTLNGWLISALFNGLTIGSMVIGVPALLLALVLDALAEPVSLQNSAMAAGT